MACALDISFLIKYFKFDECNFNILTSNVLNEKMLIHYVFEKQSNIYAYIFHLFLNIISNSKILLQTCNTFIGRMCPYEILDCFNLKLKLTIRERGETKCMCFQSSESKNLELLSMLSSLDIIFH